MNFDPAIAAQTAFAQAIALGELGAEAEAAVEAEEVFSASAGEEAKGAYTALQDMGQRYPDAASFQAFLIYITWQQVTEETIPAHFRRGLRLCQCYLDRFMHAPAAQTMNLLQIQALQESFRNGLGLADEDEHQQEYDRDAFKGGD